MQLKEEEEESTSLPLNTYSEVLKIGPNCIKGPDHMVTSYKLQVIGTETLESLTGN